MGLSEKDFWIKVMDQAWDIDEEIIKFPLLENLEPMTDLRAELASLEVMFSDTLLGEFQRLYFIREGLACKVKAAAKAFNDKGWIMKIEEGFRSVAMQTALAHNVDVLRDVAMMVYGEDPQASDELLYRRMSCMIAMRPITGGHMAGAAIDISVFSRETGEEIDRGGPYLTMSSITAMESPFLYAEALANRKAISDVMAENGFAAYPFEFWHYNQGDCLEKILNQHQGPAHYGPINFDVQTGKVSKIEKPNEPMVDIKALLKSIKCSSTKEGL